MERVLQKLAHQLVSYDETSLMVLWNKYAAIVTDFEPTRRWEEAALIFGFIQSVHMKNQLFNHHLAVRTRPEGLSLQPEIGQTLNAAGKGGVKDAPPVAGREGKGDSAGNGAQKRCKVLRFGRRKGG